MKRAGPYAQDAYTPSTPLAEAANRLGRVVHLADFAVSKKGADGGVA